MLRQDLATKVAAEHVSNSTGPLDPAWRIAIVYHQNMGSIGKLMIWYDLSVDWVFFLHDTIKGFTGSDRLGMPDGEIVDQKVMQIMEILPWYDWSTRDANLDIDFLMSDGDKARYRTSYGQCCFRSSYTVLPLTVYWRVSQSFSTSPLAPLFAKRPQLLLKG